MRETVHTVRCDECGRARVFTLKRSRPNLHACLASLRADGWTLGRLDRCGECNTRRLEKRIAAVKEGDTRWERKCAR
jgi:hypothetical protein